MLPIIVRRTYRINILINTLTFRHKLSENNKYMCIRDSSSTNNKSCKYRPPFSCILCVPLHVKLPQRLTNLNLSCAAQRAEFAHIPGALLHGVVSESLTSLSLSTRGPSLFLCHRSARSSELISKMYASAVFGIFHVPEHPAHAPSRTRTRMYRMCICPN